MKNFVSLTFLFLFCFCISCKKEDDIGISILRDEGLGLYWDHNVSDYGRQYLFNFISNKSTRDEYEFKFAYAISGNVVTVRLEEVIHKGKCQKFPGPWGDVCTSDGVMYIPEEELPTGNYDFKLVIGNVSITSKLTVENDKVTLDVPPNSLFSNNIPTIYPLPKGLIYGSVIYSGKENEKFAKNLLKDLETLDLKPAVLPPYNYRYLDPERNQHLQVASWEPDEHSISIIYRSNADFKSVFDITKKHFELSGKKLTIGIFSTSKANEIHISPYEEPRVYYGK